jgi:hypothetical protein
MAMTPSTKAQAIFITGLFSNGLFIFLSRRSTFVHNSYVSAAWVGVSLAIIVWGAYLLRKARIQHSA